MKKVILNSSIFLGTFLMIWSSASLLAGLASVNWSGAELLRQYLIATGLIQEFHTLSDFYTHIKGIEYIIAVAFLGAFPAFYIFLNKETKTAIQ